MEKMRTACAVTLFAARRIAYMQHQWVPSDPQHQPLAWLLHHQLDFPKLGGISRWDIFVHRPIEYIFKNKIECSARHLTRSCRWCSVKSFVVSRWRLKKSRLVGNFADNTHVDQICRLASLLLQRAPMSCEHTNTLNGFQACPICQSTMMATIYE